MQVQSCLPNKRTNDLVKTICKTVELRGLEPLTFSLRTRRATSCAIAPRIDGPISTETLPPSSRGRLARFVASGIDRGVCRSRRSVRCYRDFRTRRDGHGRTGKVNGPDGPGSKRLGNISRHGDRDGIPERARLSSYVGLAAGRM